MYLEKESFNGQLNYVSTIKSKVLHLNGGYYRNLIEGEPISYFSGYKVAGIFQSQDEIDTLNSASPTGVYQSGNTAPGDFKYVDVNGDGLLELMIMWLLEKRNLISLEVGIISYALETLNFPPCLIIVLGITCLIAISVIC